MKSKEEHLLEHNDEVRRQRFEAKWQKLENRLMNWAILVGVAYGILVIVNFIL